MALKQPLLTISIPTYNRAIQIQYQVRRLLPQLNEEVILVVRDNNSYEPVKNLFSNDELAFFTIEENCINIGADANIIRLFELCKTKWIWVLSDDDLVLSNAVDTILSIIHKYSNATFINIDTSKDVKLIGFDNFVTDLSTSKESFGDAFWISKGIYNMDILRPYLIHYYKNISSMIGQLIFVLKCLEQNPNLIIQRLESSVFEYKDVNISWSHLDFIKYSSMIFDVFNHKRKRFLKCNLHKIVTSTYMSMIIGINRNSKDFYQRGNFKIFTLIIFKYGFFRSFFMFPIKFCSIILFILLPTRILNKFIDILKLNFTL